MIFNPAAAFSASGSSRAESANPAEEAEFTIKFLSAV
jgi:hypothetical protein